MQCLNQRDILKKLSQQLAFYWIQIPKYLFQDDQILLSMYGSKLQYGNEWISPFKVEPYSDSLQTVYYHYFNNDSVIYSGEYNFQTIANTLGKQNLQFLSDQNSLLQMISYSFISGALLNVINCSELEVNTLFIVANIFSQFKTQIQNSAPLVVIAD